MVTEISVGSPAGHGATTVTVDGDFILHRLVNWAARVGKARCVIDLESGRCSGVASAGGEYFIAPLDGVVPTDVVIVPRCDFVPYVQVVIGSSQSLVKIRARSNRGADVTARIVEMLLDVTDCKVVLIDRFGLVSSIVPSHPNFFRINKKKHFRRFEKEVHMAVNACRSNVVTTSRNGAISYHGSVVESITTACDFLDLMADMGDPIFILSDKGAKTKLKKEDISYKIKNDIIEIASTIVVPGKRIFTVSVCNFRRIKNIYESCETYIISGLNMYQTPSGFGVVVTSNKESYHDSCIVSSATIVGKQSSVLWFKTWAVRDISESNDIVGRVMDVVNHIDM